VTDAASPRGRSLVFVLTWLSYASLYLCRKGVAVSKARLVSDLSLAEGTLAAIDTAYLVAYAAGQFASGASVDRLGSRRVIVIGLVGSALACFAFGASSAGVLLVAFFALNGLFQATGWPAGTSIMAAWYPARQRGAAMGLWSTNYQAGGLLGTALATTLLARFGWRAAIAGPGLWLLAFAGVVALLLRERPPDASDESGIPSEAGGLRSRAAQSGLVRLRRESPSPLPLSRRERGREQRDARSWGEGKTPASGTAKLREPPQRSWGFAWAELPALLLAVLGAAGCAGPPVSALMFGLEREALPEGTEVVSVAVVSGREFDFGCVGPSATLPRVGVVSSTAQLVCGIDPSCTPDAASADLLSPIPIFGVDAIADPSGVVIEEVPEGPVLVFLEAFDLDDRTLGIGCATGSVRSGEESTVQVQIEEVL